MVVFGGEMGHRRGPGAGGSQPGRFGVEGVDLVGDLAVGVGHGGVSDPGVDQGHAQCLVAEHGSDRFEAHAPVDGLGGQGVTGLVGVDVTDPGVAGEPVQHAGDLVTVKGPVVLIA